MPLPAMQMLQASRHAAAAGGLLSTATAWWVAKQNSGGNLVDQGTHSLTLTGAGTPNFTNDGTHHFVELRAADSDYFTVADNVLLDPEAGAFSVVVVFTPRVNLTSAKTVVGKRSGSNDGWVIRSSTLAAQGVVDAGSAVTPAAGNLTVGTLATLGLVINGAATFVALNGTAGSNVTSPGAVNAAFAMFVNALDSGNISGDQDLFGLAIFKGTALTAAETATVGTELLTASAV